MMADRVIFVCTIIIAAVYLYATTLIPSLEIGDPLGPKAFPRLLGIALLLSAAFLLAEILKDRKSAPQPAAGSGRFPLGIVGVIAGVSVWTGCYYVVFQPLGYIIATTIYLLGLMAWFHRGKWLSNVLSAVLFALLSYIMFVKLDVNLPRGAAAFVWLADGVHAMLDAIAGVFKSTR